MRDIAGLRLDRGDALFLDFDGTLAEIGPDPDAIRLPEGFGDVLAALAARLGGAVALISGRDLRDLARRTPAGVWRIGGHGIEVLAPGAPLPLPLPPAPEPVLEPLREAAGREGVRLEVKGPVAALHYRAAPEEEGACLAAAEAAAAAVAGHRVQRGKMVVEVKPEGAHKGAALRRAMDAPPFAGRRPVMLGDDMTDEDAMREALALGGVAVKVGAGPSVAGWHAPDPEAARRWLAREAGGAG
jgi:trehalose 6-phosphate phosphatase